ncbi:MAG: hypothetical protein R3231_03365 [bacterium]|nr:hypothetical protein [bacterium]
MENVAFEQLEEKIQKAVELISELRTVNIALKEELQAAQGRLQSREAEPKKKAVDSDALKKMKTDLKRMANERNMVRQKIRNVLRKLEGIRLAEEKPQQDLFE